MIDFPTSLHRFNHSMRGKPGLFVLVVKTHHGLEVVAAAASAIHLSTKGICPSQEPEIRYVGEITANVLD